MADLTFLTTADHRLAMEVKQTVPAAQVIRRPETIEVSQRNLATTGDVVCDEIALFPLDWWQRDLKDRAAWLNDTLAQLTDRVERQVRWVRGEAVVFRDESGRDHAMPDDRPEAERA